MSDSEHGLVKMQGTTCLTVSQRMTLPKFHQTEMKVGVATAKGWSAEAIAAGQENKLNSGSVNDVSPWPFSPCRPRLRHYCGAFTVATVTRRGAR